jgi:hypothetical protein
VVIEREFPDAAADVAFAGFKLWVHGRGHPEATDFWDGNWFRITAAYLTPHFIAICEDNILHGSDVASSLEAACRMYETLDGDFTFATLEPGFDLHFSARQHGRIDLEANFVTDGLRREEYRNLIEIDQSYLPAFIRGPRLVLSRFPLVGESTD